MENLKENVEKIEKLKKENYTINKKIDSLVDVSTELYHKNYEKFSENEKTIKKYNKQLELNKIKESIIKNNIHYLFKMDFEGIKEKILDYFINKKIGEKTKEKIENEIKEYFKNNFKIKIGCYIIQNEYSNYEYTRKEFKIGFYFLNEDDYRDFTLGYNEEFSIEFNIEIRKNQENIIKTYYFNNINDYIELKDLNKQAIKLLNEYNKTLEKIEKSRKQLKEVYHNFMDYQHGFLYYQFKIDTDINIY